MRMKKLLVAVLTVVMATNVALFTGCGTKGGAANTLEILVTDAGYGTDWVYALKDLFVEQSWVKEEYSDIKIQIATSDDQTMVQSRLNAGEKSNHYDLLFGIGLWEYFGQGGPLLDLTESVYKTTVPGEDILLYDKMDNSFCSSLGIAEVGMTDVAYYATPWVGGMEGILYNEDLFVANNLSVPNTTDELIFDVCAEYKAKGDENYSFIQSYDANYFDYLFPVWWAQYQGIDGYENYFNGIDNDTYSNRIFDQKGREYALEVFEALLDYDKGYVNPKSFTEKFQIAQSLFIDGGALMHVNGDWFSSEMRDVMDRKGDNAPKIKMMRTPIISKLGEKLGITDPELSAVVSYVDDVGAGEAPEIPSFTSSKGYSTEAVIDAVTEARMIVNTIGSAHSAVIPKYAVAKDLAIDFLRFMATDIALDVFAEKTDGATLPYDHTVDGELYGKLALAQQTRLDYFQSAYGINTLVDPQSYPLVRYGGLTPFLSERFYKQFSMENNTKTPAQYMSEMKSSWTDVKFNNAMHSARLQ